MTSLLRELVPLPMPAVASSTIVSRPAQRQLARDREADRAGPDDDGIDAVHAARRLGSGRRLAQSR